MEINNLPGELYDREEKEYFEAVRDGYTGLEHKYPRGLVPTTFTSRLRKEVSKNPLLMNVLNVMKEIDFPMVCHPKAIEYLRAKYGTDNTEYYYQSDRFNPTSKRKYVIFIEEMINTSEQRFTELGQINGSPYIFNGSYWESIEKGLFETFLTSVAEVCGLKSFDVRQPNELSKIVKQFMTSSRLPQPKPNPEEVLINLQNGTYAISKDKREFRDACSDDLIQYQLPFEYIPDAKAPLFDNYINTVLPNKELQTILFEYLGYIFVKGLKLEKCLLIIGDGANGKSVLFDIISALLGEQNISSYTLTNLCDEKGYHRAQLTNKLLNYSSELGGKNCPPDMVKKLISNEPVDARSPFGQPFELKNYCKFIFNTNTLPKEVEQTGAFFRRFMIIRFGQTIPEEKQDKELALKIIKSELPGVFQYILQGLERILENKKFTYSEEMDNELKSFKRESNSVAIFLDDEGYVPSTTHYANLKPLYEAYRTYSTSSGYLPVSKIEFVRRLKSEGIQTVKGSGNVRNVYCVKSYNPEPSNSNEPALELAFKLKN
jgi:putative DNA primase/helicase